MNFKKIILIVFSFSITIGFSQILENKIDVYLYYINYDAQEVFVHAIAKVNNNIYYLPPDINLMTYDSIPDKGILINDNTVDSLLNKLINLYHYKKTKFILSNCQVFSKSQYVLKVIENDSNYYYYFRDVIKCDKNCKENILTGYHSIFKSYESKQKQK